MSIYLTFDDGYVNVKEKKITVIKIQTVLRKISKILINLNSNKLKCNKIDIFVTS